jgi:L-iditol 2-dehydrogenase
MKGKMLAAMYYGINDVRVEYVPIPRIGADDVLLKIGAATTCGTDIKMFRRSYPGLPQLPMPYGHECAGIIQAVGKNVKQYEPGMRIVAGINSPCGECFFCRRDQTHFCERPTFGAGGGTMAGGAYAEYLFIPGAIARNNIHIIPENLSFEEAALVEPLACALFAIEDVPLRLGDTITIIGGGSIGQMFVMLGKAAGATVILCEKHDARLKAAKDNGADLVINVLLQPDYVQIIRDVTGGYGPDITLDATGSPNGWLDAINIVRRAGTVMLFGGCKPGTSIELDTRRMHYDCLTLKSPSVYHQTPDLLHRSLGLLSTGIVNGKGLITGRVPLSDMLTALQRIIAGEGLKFAIIPPDMKK